MKHVRIGGLVLMGLLICAGPVATLADDTTIVAGMDQRTGLNLTVYQNGLALVDEVRHVTTHQETEKLVISGISPRLIPGSAQLTGAGLSIRALDYRLSGLSPRALLARSVGRQVGIIKTHPTTGEESIIPAQVLSVAEGVVLRIDGRFETGIPGRLVFDDIPADLEYSPAVVAMINAGESHDGDIGFQYLSDGLGWRADHTVNVHETATGLTLDLESWASVENNTGVSFDQASLALVAGSVNRTSQPQPQLRMETMSMAMADAPGGNQPSREALGDFHLYAVPGTFDLTSPGNIQVLLGTQTGLAAEKQYVLNGNGQAFYGRVATDQQPLERADIRYRFTNEGSEPLAGGTARLYGVDSQGIKRFLGEAHLSSSATGDQIVIGTGKAFDLSASRKQLGFERRGANNNVFETSHELILRNASPRDATMEVREQVVGDWEILETSHANARDGMTAVWKIDIPASGEVVLRYRIRIQR